MFTTHARVALIFLAIAVLCTVVSPAFSIVPSSERLMVGTPGVLTSPPPVGGYVGQAGLAAGGSSTESMAALEANAGFGKFVAEAGPGWAFQWNTVTGTPHLASGKSLDIGNGYRLNKVNIESTCLSFVSDNAQMLKTDPSQLRLASAVNAGSCWYVAFQQVHGGVPIFGGQLTMSFTKDDRLIMFGSDVYPDVAGATTPKIDKKAAAETALEDCKATHGKDQVSDPELSILPIARAGGFDYFLCWKLSVNQQASQKKWQYFVDAQTGRVVAKWNALVYQNITGTAHGDYKPEFMGDSNQTGTFGHESGVASGSEVAIGSWTMDSNPGWTLQGSWAFGAPAGGGSHNMDPASGHSGANVIGYNLSGDYADGMGTTMYATTPAVNCSGYSHVQLRFWRWLGVESSSFDHANVQVSSDGSSWTDVWNHSGASLSESGWSLQQYDISATADNHPTVYVRWGMGPTDSSVTYPGWNLDDVQVVSVTGSPTSFYTQADGSYSVVAPSDPTTISSSLGGRYCDIVHDDGAGPQFQTVDAHPGGVVDWNWNSDLYGGASHVHAPSVYWHVNHIHDYYKTLDPSFAGLDYPVVTHVGLAGYNNAYWDGTGITFGGGDGASFNDFGLFAEVVYHEYTHGVTDKIYTGVSFPYAMEPGAMNEGWSDYFGATLSLSQLPKVGDGGLVVGQPNGFRTMDNSFRRETSFVNEVHDDSQMFSGALWEARTALGEAVMDPLVHFARYRHGADFESYLTALLAEDDSRYGDGDLTNGTPHGEVIYAAFGNHGMGGLQYQWQSMAVNDSGGTGNNDGKLDPGEDVGLSLTLANGWANANSVHATLATSDPYVTITKATASFPDVTRGGTTSNFADAFGLSVSPTCPETHTINFTLTVTAEGPYTYSRTCLVYANVAVRQLAYDDGAADSAFGYGASGGGFALRMTPTAYPCFVTHARVWPLSSATINVCVWDDNGVGGSPGSLLGSQSFSLSATNAWTDLDISSLNINITEGSVYVGWIEGGTIYYNGTDFDPPYAERTWIYDGSSWAQIEVYGVLSNMMVRARYSDAPPLHINEPYEYSWCIGQPVSECLSTSDGIAPLTWSIAGGALPVGVGLDPAAGCFVGSPVEPGTYTATVQVTDSSPTPKQGAQQFTFAVGSGPEPPANPSPADGATGVMPGVILSWGGHSGLYTEDFNDGLAQDWLPSGDWQVVSGEYQAAAPTLVQSVYTGSVWTDCSVQVTMRNTGATDSCAFALLRASADYFPASSGTGYLVGVTPDGMYNVFLQNQDGGTVSLQSWAPSSYLHTGGEANVVMMSISGSTIKVFFNQNLAWSGTNSSISGPGRVGLVANSGSSPAVYYFDDVVVDQPVAVLAGVGSQQQAYNAYSSVTGSPYQAPSGLARPSAPAGPNGSMSVGFASAVATSSTTYDVYLGDSCQSLTLIASDLTSRAIDPPGNLQELTTYVWKVVAKDACGVSEGPCWTFTTGTCADSIPKNPDPVDGATDVPVATVLSWNGNGGGGSPDDPPIPPTVGATGDVTINASDRGWWKDNGSHDPANKNTFTGQDGDGTEIVRSFFVFDLSAVPAGSVTGATLRLEVENYVGPDSSESLTIYDVSTPISTLTSAGTNVSVFDDLGAGNAYGSFTATPSSVGTILEITLNGRAVADLSAAAGGYFAVGLNLDNIGLPSGDEGVRFSESDEARVHQLVLNTGGQSSTTYDVYMGSSCDSMSLVGPGLTQTTFDPPGNLQASTTYFWKVVSKNSCGDIEGPCWSFTTGLCPIPVPIEPSPVDGATEVSRSTVLSWNTADSATYDVYMGDSCDTLSLAASNLSQPTFDPAGELRGVTTYFWKVVSKNSCGSLAGPCWSFTTEPCYAPTPANPNPPDGATDVSATTTLSWTTGPSGGPSVASPPTSTPASPAGNVAERNTTEMATVEAHAPLGISPLPASSGTSGRYGVLENTGEGYDNSAVTHISSLPNLSASILSWATVAASSGSELRAAYDVIYFSVASSQSDYNHLIAAVANGGPLESFTALGGALVLNVASNSGSQLNIAPGGLTYNRDIAHEAESIASPSHPYITGAGYGGTPLTESMFDDWSSTDHGTLESLPPGSTTILTNDDGVSMVEYPWGGGRVIVSSLTFGWFGGDNEHSAQPFDNQLLYAASLAGGGTSYDVYMGDSCDNMTKIAEGISQPAFDPGLLVMCKTYYWRVVAKTECGETSGPCWSFTTGGSPVTKPADGASVSIGGAIVSAAFPDYFYIESADRRRGIRAEKPDHGLTVGRRVNVGGVIHTNLNGERFIEVSDIVDVTEPGCPIISPWLMSGKTMGGGDWQYDPVTKAGQKGISPGRWLGMGHGLNNIGLLARIWGRVTASGTGPRGLVWFYLDDGSRVQDGTGIAGVYAESKSGITVPTVGSLLFVTGISSCEYYMDNMVNLLLVRGPADILTIEEGPLTALQSAVSTPGVRPRDAAK